MYPMLFSFLALLLLLGISLLFLLLKFRKFEKVYKPKGNFLLSAGEKRFFDALTHSVTADMYICPKVRIADLIEIDIPKNDPNFWRYFRHISQKHIDFVICRRSDFKPLLIIELDGGSHNDPKRIDRDAFVNNAFLIAGIPLLHIPITSFYSYEELQKRITSALQTN